MAGTGTRFTYGDYLLLPEGKRYEILEGDLVVVPSPGTDHQRISRNLEVRLWEFVRERGLGEVLHAPLDVVLAEEDVVQPDIIFISRPRLGIVAEKGIRGAPDLVVEILSPGTAERDRTVKEKLYHRFGVREFWLVDPAARTVEIKVWAPEGFRTAQVYPEGTALRSPLLDGLAIDVGAIFP